MNPQNNLDYLAAKHAHAIIVTTQESKAKDMENTLTKTLGVLQEQGVYACFLYLVANGKENGKTIIQKMLALFQELQLPEPPPEGASEQDVLRYITDQLTTDLPRLLLAREALEQMLIYARYGAKAKG